MGEIMSEASWLKESEKGDFRFPYIFDGRRRARPFSPAIVLVTARFSR